MRLPGQKVPLIPQQQEAGVRIMRVVYIEFGGRLARQRGYHGEMEVIAAKQRTGAREVVRGQLVQHRALLLPPWPRRIVCAPGASCQRCWAGEQVVKTTPGGPAATKPTPGGLG
jgi:hypothetical protein